MVDLLPFFTSNIRKKKMTVDEFCARIGISRQKFYRFVKEPHRFSDDNIRAITEVLSLSESDEALLKDCIYSKQQAIPVSLSEYDAQISGILSQRLAEELSLDIHNIEYTDTGKLVTIESPESLAYKIAGSHRFFSRSAVSAPGSSDGSFAHTHEFLFTIYNCICEKADPESARKGGHNKNILTITSLIRKLEDILTGQSAARFHIRHYLSENHRRALSADNINDKDTMQNSLHLFNAVLPLLSTTVDYHIDQSEMTKHFWTEHSNYCLIRHTCTYYSVSDEEYSNAEYSEAPQADTTYYILVFSESGECCACRLGSENVSHIYRFLSIDTLEKDSSPLKRNNRLNPNQFFQQLDNKSRHILIHPDLCFDDIPKKMWMALYKDMQQRPEKAIFENMFRSLMDPYGQYSFLSFQDLVLAALETLEKRATGGEQMGKIVICHPDGLMSFIQNGIITDLTSESFDYTGKDQSIVPLRFPDTMIRQLLGVIRSSIVRRQKSAVRDPLKYEWTNYYILHPNFPCPDVSFVIYKDHGVTPLYNRGRHKNSIVNIFPNPTVGNLMYDYVVREMIGKRGQGLVSNILSDEHSIALIDSLIAQV